MGARNGILRGEYKVKNGKLIKCWVRIKENVIEEIKITGDFFMYPEEKIEELEERLRGMKYEREEIKRVLRDFFNGVKVIGADEEDFLKVIVNTNA